MLPAFYSILHTPHQVHLCAVGSIDEMIADPYAAEPPLPPSVPAEEIDAMVRGPLGWLIDNPGRQHVGSFRPITVGDW